MSNLVGIKGFTIPDSCSHCDFRVGLKNEVGHYCLRQGNQPIHKSHYVDESGQTHDKVGCPLVECEEIVEANWLVITEIESTEFADYYNDVGVCPVCSWKADVNAIEGYSINRCPSCGAKLSFRKEK